ncbi:thioredoxin [Clostridium acetobutylicum]|nr:thioredoxin [Clostridium acetobutylicum]
MESLQSIKEIREYIENNELVLMYFRSDNSGICHALDPLIEAISKKYSKISSVKVNTGNLPSVPADFKIFTVPEVIIFMNGSIVIEHFKYINFREIEEVLLRYYKCI